MSLASNNSSIVPLVNARVIRSSRAPRSWAAAGALLALLGGGDTTRARETRQASGEASPIERFARVDERLYRGAQPSADGFRHLRALGITTVINLRTAADAERTGEQRLVESLGMRYINVPVKDGNVFTWYRRIPEASIVDFLDAVDASEGPVFVHCRRGTDRTGAMVAFYRIARSGWDPARAAREAEDRGMRAWYRGLRRQIKGFDPATLLPQRQ